MKTILALLLLAGSALAAPTTVTVSCTANPASQGITAYKVYEHVGTTYTLIASSATPAVSFPIPANTTVQHAYSMTASNAIAESGKSADVILPVLPTVPQSVILVVQ